MLILFLQAADGAVVVERHSAFYPGTSALTKGTALSACQSLISWLKLTTRMPINTNVAGVNMRTRTHSTKQAEQANDLFLGGKSICTALKPTFYSSSAFSLLTTPPTKLKWFFITITWDNISNNTLIDCTVNIFIIVLLVTSTIGVEWSQVWG